MSASVAVPLPDVPKRYARSPHSTEWKSGQRRGPRELRRIVARVPAAVAEMLSAIFDVQRGADDDEPQHPVTTAERELLTGEVLETYVLDSAPLLFGLTYFEFARKRAKGAAVNLRALFELRHAAYGGVQ